MTAGLFGLMTLILVGLLTLRLIVQRVVAAMRKEKREVPAALMSVNRILMRSHRYLGMAAVLTVLTHMAWMWSMIGRPSLPGLVAAIFLFAQMGLGLAMLKAKGESRRKLAQIHTLAGVLLVLAVLVHRL